MLGTVVVASLITPASAVEPNSVPTTIVITGHAKIRVDEGVWPGRQRSVQEDRAHPRPDGTAGRSLPSAGPAQLLQGEPEEDHDSQG